MFNPTPFLPGLSHRLFGRQRRSQLDLLRAQAEQWRASSLSRLCEIFGPWLPGALLSPTDKGVNSRQRLYPLTLTFWAFLSQVLSPGSACREVVRKVQAWYAPQDKSPDSVQEAKASQQGISTQSLNPEDRDREIYEVYCELDIKGFEHKHKGKQKTCLLMR